jgi:hypothetical protein
LFAYGGDVPDEIKQAVPSGMVLVDHDGTCHGDDSDVAIYLSPRNMIEFAQSLRRGRTSIAR